MPDASRAASRSDDFLPENVGIGTIFLALKAFTDLNGLKRLNRRLPSCRFGVVVLKALAHSSYQ